MSQNRGSEIVETRLTVSDEPVQWEGRKEQKSNVETPRKERNAESNEPYPVLLLQKKHGENQLELGDGKANRSHSITPRPYR
jgi:hypothetical protein